MADFAFTTLLKDTPGAGQARVRIPAVGDKGVLPGPLQIAAGTHTTAVPALDLAQTWNSGGTTFTGLKFNVTDTASAAGSLLADFQVGGVSKFSVTKESVVTFGSGTGRLSFDCSASWNSAIKFNGTTIFSISDASAFTINGTNAISSYLGFGPGGGDVRLYRDGAANTLAQRNGTNAQAFNLYNTYTDGSNYERGSMRWSSNVLIVGQEAAGTGALRDVFLGTGSKGIQVSPGANSIFLKPSGGSGPVFLNGAMGFSGWNGAAEYPIFGGNQAGNSNRIGSDVGIYGLGGSGNALAGQVVLYASLAVAAGTAGHTFEAAVRTWLPAAGMPGMQFGGTSSSFPGLKRSAATLQARLADDSAFAELVFKLPIANPGPGTLWNNGGVLTIGT